MRRCVESRRAGRERGHTVRRVLYPRGGVHSSSPELRERGEFGHLSGSSASAAALSLLCVGRRQCADPDCVWSTRYASHSTRSGRRELVEVLRAASAGPPDTRVRPGGGRHRPQVHRACAPAQQARRCHRHAEPDRAFAGWAGVRSSGGATAHPSRGVTPAMCACILAQAR